MDGEEEEEEENREIDEAEIQVNPPSRKSEGISFLKALCIPGVVPVSVFVTKKYITMSRVSVCSNREVELLYTKVTLHT